MAVVTVDQVYDQVRALTPAERLRLVERIAHDLSEEPRGNEPSVHRRSWSEIRGIVPYPMFGEDAQSYISRTREEADEARELRERNGP